MRVRHIIRPTDWVKNFLGISIGLALIVVLMKTLQSLDTNQLWATFADVAPIQWATAIGFTAISFAALGRYDVIIHKVLNTGISSRLAFRSGMIGIALAQVLGFGLITGSLVRWRVLGGLSLTRCGAVTVFASMSFLIALAALIGVTLFFVPLPLPAWVPVAAGVSFILIVALVAFAPLRLVPRLARHWPGLLAARGIFIWTAIDTLAAASAFYVLLPAEHGVPLITIFAIYLVALGAGLVSNAPGGLGAFELTALALLPSLAPETVVASILAFRLVYYALPAVVAICFLVPKPKETVPNATAGIDFYPDSVTLNTAQSRQAEAGLIRQQHAGFLVAGRGHRTAHWLVAPLAHYGVAIGRPLGSHADRSQSIETMSEFACDALKVPAYYKVDQRTAANIRRTGFTCLKIAEEAVIDPSSFSLEGSKSRQLRRVLRKAQTIDVQHSLPFMSHPVADMRAVHDAWRSTHHGEHGFSMGRFCPDYLSSQRVVLAYDKDRLVGFMTFHVGAKEWTLDLVRITNTAPSGTAQLLITNAIEAAKSDAIRRLSLAAAPIDPVAHLSNSQRIIGHYQDHGLRRFKAAFDPRWEPLYMLAPNRFHLTFCALCLLVAIKSPNQSSRTS